MYDRYQSLVYCSRVFFFSMTSHLIGSLICKVLEAKVEGKHTLHSCDSSRTYSHIVGDEILVHPDILFHTVLFNFVN